MSDFGTRRDASEAHAAPFDAFEVAVCAPLYLTSGGDSGYGPGDVERIDTAEHLTEIIEEHGEDVLIYTVYGHRPNQGVWAIGDFTSKEHAMNMAHALAATPRGVPIHDETP